MKLVKQKAANSFFESFSDLIFATMAIFVMLLIIFISQNGADDVRTEYTGNSAASYSLIAHVPVKGTPSVLFFPIAVADRFNLQRKIGLNDPLLKLSQASVSEDGLVSIPISEYLKIASGVSKGFAMGIRSQGEGTIEAALLLEATTVNATPQSAEKLKAAIFGKNTLRVLGAGSGKNKIHLTDKWRSRYLSISTWMQSQEKGNFHSWVKQSREPLRRKAQSRDDKRSVVTYRVTSKNEVRIGGAKLSAQQFRAFLRSIHAGADFALIHLNHGDSPIVPPNWVIDEILIPTGFTAVR